MRSRSWNKPRRTEDNGISHLPTGAEELPPDGLGLRVGLFFLLKLYSLTNTSSKSGQSAATGSG